MYGLHQVMYGQQYVPRKLLEVLSARGLLLAGLGMRVGADEAEIDARILALNQDGMVRLTPYGTFTFTPAVIVLGQAEEDFLPL